VRRQSHIQQTLAKRILPVDGADHGGLSRLQFVQIHRGLPKLANANVRLASAASFVNSAYLDFQLILIKKEAE
jgi:hypothetical protein